MVAKAFPYRIGFCSLCSCCSNIVQSWIDKYSFTSRSLSTLPYQDKIDSVFTWSNRHSPLHLVEQDNWNARPEIWFLRGLSEVMSQSLTCCRSSVLCLVAGRRWQLLLGRSQTSPYGAQRGLWIEWPYRYWIKSGILVEFECHSTNTFWDMVEWRTTHAKNICTVRYHQFSSDSENFYPKSADFKHFHDLQEVTIRRKKEKS